MEEEEKVKEFIKYTVEYIDSLTDVDYFKITVQDCIDLNVLHEVTIKLIKRFGFKNLFFNKYDYTNFHNIFEEPINWGDDSKLVLKSEIMRFAIDSFAEGRMEPVKLDWDGNENLSAEIFLTSMFLWVGNVFTLIKHTTPDYPYEMVKNHFLGKILQLNSEKFEFNFPDIILKTVIEYLGSIQAKGNLLLFKLDLETIYQTFSKNLIPRAEKNNLVGGKKLNYADKYMIISELFGVNDKLRDLNIKDTRKHILLSQILGCNQQTARELYNGTIYRRTRVQEDIVLPYLESIKGN